MQRATQNNCILEFEKKDRNLSAGTSQKLHRFIIARVITGKQSQDRTATFENIYPAVSLTYISEHSFLNQKKDRENGNHQIPERTATKNASDH